MLDNLRVVGVSYWMPQY